MSLGPKRLTSPQVLGFSLAALLLPTIWIECRVLMYTHGIIAYPLDDTFIHLSVARNVAFHHYWGITGGIFASASSSPFYTILLAAAFLIFGAHTVLPLLINFLAAVIVVVAAHRWLQRQLIPSSRQLVILLAFIFLTPLPLLIISGMEHTLQLLFAFLFIFSFSDAATVPRPLPWTLYLYSALMVTTRYECLTILGIACLILFYRRRWMSAIGLGVLSVLPITLFGIYAVSKGSFFMPNSVLLKSNIPHHLYGLKIFLTEDIWNKLFFPARGDLNFLAAQRLLLLLPLCAIIYRPILGQRPAYRNILLILIGAVFAHLAFAFPANFPRYEAYLVGCSVIVMGAMASSRPYPFSASRYGGPAWAAAGFLAILVFPFLLRAASVFSKSRQYCVNIYEQQYQMARFVHRYYDTTSLAFNDIGAISYYSSGPKLDLFGLASLKVAKARRAGYWSAGYADSLVHDEHIRLAIVYDTWQDPQLLHRWHKVASWRNYNNVVLGDDSVSFYSIDPADSALLRQNLAAFQATLPGDVTVKYY